MKLAKYALHALHCATANVTSNKSPYIVPYLKVIETLVNKALLAHMMKRVFEVKRDIHDFHNDSIPSIIGINFLFCLSIQ